MAESIQRTVGATYGGRAIAETETISGERVQILNPTIPQSATDQLVTATFDKDQLEYLLIKTSGNLTLETNSGSEADDTFSLVAGKTFEWRKGSGIPNPFTADVSALYFTNGVATAQTVEILITEADITP